VFYKRYLKRLFDFVLSLVGFIILSPVFLLVAILLFIFNSGKPFFIQERPGKDERLFRIIKFKTMNDRRDTQGNLFPDAERLTSIGSFIRKTSLDEMPQLLNVIKGEMSIIGPRPLMPEYLSLYSSVQRRRHEIRPGISGWAQVNGRNAISWKQKFEYDVWYVDNISFMLDLEILFMTFKKVVIKEGINMNNNIASNEAFNGEN
jgi:lipopolysaccharide/colanic/teichoic acid biosynthesis glycosyltransferase